MTGKLAALFLLLSASACAHRLDEYLQASLLSVEKERVNVSLRLIPGVAVSAVILAGIDKNGDGVLSESERRAYATSILTDLTLSADGDSLTPVLVSVRFPEMAEMKEGLGEIQLEFTAKLPPGGWQRKIVFENHHQTRVSAYLVNCLVPRDRGIQITAQNRNASQSFYELDYVLNDGPAQQVQALNSGGFSSMFRLGMRHIAEGTDHLLFLLVLLLPAPLLAVRSRWAGFGGAEYSWSQILKVVTAFTAGHSVTLALAAAGWIHIPNQPVEVLIAVSILISALHALCPLFPGREAGIAAFFGLVHGLAFAATLGQLELGWWERLSGILGFNLGIEAMQLMVIAAVMPSLLLLSRTPAYSVLRVSGAVFAGLAAGGWTVERLLNRSSRVDLAVGSVASHAVWIAIFLFLISLQQYWRARRPGLSTRREVTIERSNNPGFQSTIV